MRWPSLKFQTGRRFVYIQFASSVAAHRATELDGTVTENEHKLVVKISDPSQKTGRSGAMAEGREIFCRNVDYKLSEKDLQRTFSRFGTVENINFPRSVDGRRRGFCFITFSSKVRFTPVFPSFFILTFDIVGGERRPFDARRDAWCPAFTR